MPTETEELKRALRRDIRQRRLTRTAEQRDAAAADFTRNLIALTTQQQARVVACYLSSPLEPNTRPYVAWAAAHGVDTLIPISRDDGLLDWVYGGGPGETAGLFGILEPVGARLGLSAIRGADLILTPAAAIDADGMRMGWGRGFFDKTLASLDRRPPVFAIVHDDEVLDVVPRESHDQPVDGVVTPPASCASPPDSGSVQSVGAARSSISSPIRSTRATARSKSWTAVHSPG